MCYIRDILTNRAKRFIGHNPAGAVIDCREDSGVCTSEFSKASSVTITATPDSNNIFLRWEGDCEGSEPTCSLKFKGGAKFVTAIFEGVVVSYPAPVQATGQVTCWDADGFEIPCAGTGQDGDIRAGVQTPGPRFTEEGDGMVLDNMTGLLWLKNGNCVNTNYPELSNDLGKVSWQMALDFVAGVNTGTYYCGTDAVGWRLPNVRELLSLIDYESVWGRGSALPHPFQNVASNYWSSTTGPSNAAYAVDLVKGQSNHRQKNLPYQSVILVRDSQ